MIGRGRTCSVGFMNGPKCSSSSSWPNCSTYSSAGLLQSSACDLAHLAGESFESASGACSFFKKVRLRNEQSTKSALSTKSCSVLIFEDFEGGLSASSKSSISFPVPHFVDFADFVDCSFRR